MVTKEIDGAERKAVIVRTYSAGVHFGYLMSREGKEVTLAQSRRIWQWQGAWTLSEIAIEGLDSKRSKISAAVSNIVLTEAIEVIDCEAAGVKAIEAAKWEK